MEKSEKFLKLKSDNRVVYVKASFITAVEIKSEYITCTYSDGSYVKVNNMSDDEYRFNIQEIDRKLNN